MYEDYLKYVKSHLIVRNGIVLYDHKMAFESK